MSKLNIFGNQWIDMVFEGRNKKYGAYQLRSENPKTTIKSLIIGALLFSFLVAIPKIYEAVGSLATKQEEEQVKVIELESIPEPIVELPPPPPEVEVKQAPKNIVEEVKLKPLEAVKKEEVPEDPPKQEQFVNADPGKENKEAAPELGDISLGESGDLNKGVEPVDDKIHTTVGLQVQPEFPGGIAGFYNYVKKNFNVPESDRDIDVKVLVSFVIEKDGSLTDIQVVRDPGYGLKKEALRMLKNLKIKWRPGVQNGKTVRVRYSLPIQVTYKAS